MEFKTRKSIYTWNDTQVCPWGTKWSRSRPTVLTREHTGHSKHPLPETQETTPYIDIIRWLIPKSDWLYSLQQRWRNSIQSAKIRPGAHCGSDHELFIAKLRLKLKKVGETTGPSRYEINQISYDYTVEVTNRFNGLDLIDRVPEKLWTQIHNIV